MLRLTFVLALLSQSGPEFETFKKESLAKEAKGAWKRIEWQKDITDALEKAKSDLKPILVVLVVGEKAKKNAAVC